MLTTTKAQPVNAIPAIATFGAPGQGIAGTVASFVVDLDSRRPHYGGLFSCLSCRHEWVGVAPVAARSLECPSCGGMFGAPFSAREVRLIRALEEIATGRAPNHGAALNLAVVKDIACEALKAEGWPA